jgi:hypothetical protein
VATLAETITVSGQSPLVDVTSTRGGTTVSQKILAATPNNNNYQDLYLMVGGTVYTGPPLTGQQGLRANGTTPKTYGYWQGSSGVVHDRARDAPVSNELGRRRRTRREQHDRPKQQPTPYPRHGALLTRFVHSAVVP